jgi:hypothetical protein
LAAALGDLGAIGALETIKFGKNRVIMAKIT